jgi:hypothetical protein
MKNKKSRSELTACYVSEYIDIHRNLSWWIKLKSEFEQEFKDLDNEMRKSTKKGLSEAQAVTALILPNKYHELWGVKINPRSYQGTGAAIDISGEAIYIHEGLRLKWDLSEKEHVEIEVKLCVSSDPSLPGFQNSQKERIKDKELTMVIGFRYSTNIIPGTHIPVIGAINTTEAEANKILSSYNQYSEDVNTLKGQALDLSIRMNQAKYLRKDSCPETDINNFYRVFNSTINPMSLVSIEALLLFHLGGGNNPSYHPWREEFRNNGKISTASILKVMDLTSSRYSKELEEPLFCLPEFQSKYSKKDKINHKNKDISLARREFFHLIGSTIAEVIVKTVDRKSFDMEDLLYSYPEIMGIRILNDELVSILKIENPIRIIPHPAFGHLGICFPVIYQSGNSDQGERIMAKTYKEDIKKLKKTSPQSAVRKNSFSKKITARKTREQTRINKTAKIKNKAINEDLMISELSRFEEGL